MAKVRIDRYGTNNEKVLRIINCPCCKVEHAIGTHTWNNSIDSPTFSPSLLWKAPGFRDNQDYTCHSYIRDGKIQFLPDCTHELAGQTVDLPDVELRD